MGCSSRFVKKQFFRISMLCASALFVLGIVLSAAYAVGMPVYAADGSIRVLLDGREIGFDVDPIAENGRTLVPLRAISEALGFDVRWVQETSTINMNRGDSYIKMVLGKPSMFVDGQIVYLDVASKALAGRTLVPLRAISEALGLDVKWVSDSRTVELSSRDVVSDALVNIKKGTHIISNKRDDFYFEASISGDTLDVSLKLDDKFDYIVMQLKGGDALEQGRFMDFDKKRIDYMSGEMSASFELGSAKYYYVEVWKYSSTGVGSYQGVIAQGDSELIIENKGGEYVFSNPAYESSAQVFLGIGKPENYLDLNHLTAAEISVIKNLSDSICHGAENDYQKARLLHDWMTKNIYYDYDNMGNGNAPYDSPDVLNAKRTVCGGFANLYRDMLRSQGIPCTNIIGDSRWQGYEEYENSPDHGWNVLFANGRWVHVDVTWDTQNSFQGGVFEDGDRHSRYFDVDFEYMTLDHRFDEIEHDAWRYNY